MATKRIGDILVENNVVSKEQIEEIFKIKDPDEKIGVAIVRLGIAEEGQILDALERQTGVKRISLLQYPIEDKVIKLVSEEYAKRNKVMPIKVEGKDLTIAVSDPLDFFVTEDLRQMTGYNIELVLASLKEIEVVISKYYGFAKSLDALGLEEDIQETYIKDSETEVEEDKNPLVQLVDNILLSAVRQKASDIHIEPMEAKVTIRFRVDGTLKIEKEIPKKVLAQLISRIKVISKLDILETRIPQDGKIKMVIQNYPLDLRVSTLPTVNGEKVVIRVLNLTQSLEGFSGLGLNIEEEKKVKNAVSKPYGIVLVTGPTGSGKSTTLYSSLSYLNNEKTNIITVEDPVEMELDGINQVSVNEEVGLTFASALKSILRQDPNVIMLGEIRDLQTAEIALRAALTGHLVLSTLHTNSSIKSIDRLVDLGIKPFLVASAIVAIVAQRLVRKLCTECAYLSSVTSSELELLEKNNIKMDELMRAKGCTSCGGSGYSGRIGIYEILEVDDKLKNLISNGANNIELKEHLEKQGMKFLLQKGLVLVERKITSLDEILRVTME